MFSEFEFLILPVCSLAEPLKVIVCCFLSCLLVFPYRTSTADYEPAVSVIVYNLAKRFQWSTVSFRNESMKEVIG